MTENRSLIKDTCYTRDVPSLVIFSVDGEGNDGYSGGWIALSGQDLKHGLHVFSKWRSIVHCRDLNVVGGTVNLSSSIEKEVTEKTH